MEQYTNSTIAPPRESTCRGASLCRTGEVDHVFATGSDEVLARAAWFFRPARPTSSPAAVRPLQPRSYINDPGGD